MNVLKLRNACTSLNLKASLISRLERNVIVYRNGIVCMRVFFIQALIHSVSLILKVVVGQFLGEVLHFMIEMHLLDEHYSIQLQQRKPSVMLRYRKVSSVCWEPSESQLHCLPLFHIIFNMCVVLPSVSKFSFDTSRSDYFSHDFLNSPAIFICVEIESYMHFLFASCPTYEQPL